VLAAAALLRGANLAFLSSSPFFRRPTLDGAFCDRWALDILAGSAPATPFYQDPLYPHLLALLYRLFGHDYLPVYVLQLLLGLGVVAVVFDLTRRLFDLRSAVAAGLFAAAYRPFLFYEGQVEKTAVAVALTAIWLWLSVRGLEGRRKGDAFLAGLALGLACLTRGNLLAFVPLLALLFLLAPTRPRVGEASRRGVALATVALAGSLCVLAPVALRNSLLGGELLLTTTQFGQNFYAGNNAANRDGQNGTPPWVRTAPEFEEEDFAAHARHVEGRALSRREVSLFYVRQAVAWIGGNPGDFLSLTARKAALYVSRHEVPDNADIGFFGRYSPLLRPPLPGFGAVFALGFAGMALLGRVGVARRALMTFFWLYALATVAFFVLSRFRVLAVPALLPFAGAFVVWSGESAAAAARGEGVRRPLRGLALAAVGLALTLLPVPGVSSVTAGSQSLVNLGAQLYQEGDVDAAAAAFRDALGIDPRSVSALRSLGVLEFGRGNRAAAQTLLTQALEAGTEDPVSHYYLGMIREEQGDIAAAAGHYVAAARLLPGREDIRAALARTGAGVRQEPGSGPPNPPPPVPKGE
jgi:4-amino-4-deoxy-L-arabinose transferase-like glycosyltransferase